MSKFAIKFRDHAPLLAEIHDTTVGNQYYQLVKEQYTRQMPIYRDTLKYTGQYMRELCLRAKKAFGWTWAEHEDLTDGIAPSLHKNLETLLANGFDSVPAEHDELLHEIHYCLHLNQCTKKSNRASWLQIEWYVDNRIPLDHKFEFRNYMNFGDLKLQNPFVGHGPFQIYTEQDGANISQTCRFHDHICPGINIAQGKYPVFNEPDQLIEFFIKNDPAFVQLHGVDKILHYTGYPVVGQIKNYKELEIVLDSGVLEFESLTFDE